MSVKKTDEKYMRRIDATVKELRGWDWGDVEERDLQMVECSLHDGHYIRTITDVPDNNSFDEKTTQAQSSTSSQYTRFQLSISHHVAMEPSRIEGRALTPVSFPIIEQSQEVATSISADHADHGFHSSDSDRWSSSTDEATPIQFHSYVMRVALKALIDSQITVVEYGSQVQYRCGYREVLILAEWAIPDEQLQAASQALTDAGFPRISAELQRECHGLWGTESPSLRHMLLTRAPGDMYTFCHFRWLGLH
ncbi:hypothetical protein N7478_011956 [Penicillium angulare]|uniref:uncharacterized protein n=1 Tax=Penicillium angulare TaxID=116970 RepID=UPI0025424BF8|nr:uncharacterized protein N7478_011956 [Penicillium angulare]KAJ5261361.1 hypothetical protein N7478_011956 [Penicillium angulare]